MKDGPDAALFARYAARLTPRLTLVEIAESANLPPAEARRRDNELLRTALPVRGQIVALDEGGTAWSSAEFAQRVQHWQAQQAPLFFVIGGAEGLDEATLARAQATLSLGPMTWPHLLARVLLAEQLYRAQSIARGHPYHRAGRPG